MTRRASLMLLSSIALFLLVAQFNGTVVKGQFGGSDKAGSNDNEDLFKDRILLIEVEPADSDGDSNSVAIDGVRTTKIGSRDFVVGEGYATDDDEDGWYDGITIGIPCENIIRFQSMTPERYKEYLKMWKEHRNEQ